MSSPTAVPAQSVVAAQDLCKVFGEGQTAVDALAGVDIAVVRGEFVAVMGPSGSGKSTLLHLLGGLDRPTSGRIQIAGEEITALDDDRLTRLRRRRIGFVFQAFNLVQVLDAAENVALPLVIDGVPAREADERARVLLGRVGLDHRSAHVPSELSGGEQQRVALARALVIEPDVLLADEPTGNLDSRRSRELMDLLRAQVDEGGQTILMVTHDVHAAARADRILWLRDGRVLEEERLGPGTSVADILRRLEALA